MDYSSRKATSGSSPAALRPGIQHASAVIAKNSAAIMQQRGLTSAVVVTQYFHITRARYALRRAGVAMGRV